MFRTLEYIFKSKANIQPKPPKSVPSAIYLLFIIFLIITTYLLLSEIKDGLQIYNIGQNGVITQAKLYKKEKVISPRWHNYYYVYYSYKTDENPGEVNSSHRVNKRDFHKYIEGKTYTLTYSKDNIKNSHIGDIRNIQLAEIIKKDSWDLSIFSFVFLLLLTAVLLETIAIINRKRNAYRDRDGHR